MAGLGCESGRKARQSRFCMRHIGQQAIAFIMFNGQRRRIKFMQLVLHRMGEAHLQYQHQKAGK